MRRPSYGVMLGSIVSFHINTMAVGNMNQSPQERQDFTRTLNHLFNVKGAICQVMDADPKRLVIDKINNKVFNVDGSDLQLICTMTASGIIKYEDNVDMLVQNRFNELITNYYGARRSSHVSPLIN